MFASVAAAIVVDIVVIVLELTPPTLFTVGALAVPPKSFVNCNFPFVLDVASGVTLFVILAKTNSVVATCVVFVPNDAVGAVGVPVNEGDAMVARNAISLVFDVMLAVFEAIFKVLVVTIDGKVEIVDELTPPTLFIVVEKVPVPLPVTSPIKVIN